MTNTLKALPGWVLADSRPQFVVWPLNARNDWYIVLKRLNRLIYSCMRQLVFHYCCCLLAWPEVGNDKDLQREHKYLHTHVHTLPFPLPNFISWFIYPSLILSFPQWCPLFSLPFCFFITLSSLLSLFLPLAPLSSTLPPYLTQFHPPFLHFHCSLFRSSLFCPSRETGRQ